MWWILCLFFLSFSSHSETLSLNKKYQSFLKDKQEKNLFEQNKITFLNSFLKNRGKEKKSAVTKEKARQEYEKKQKEIESRRKKAFLKYKTQYALYHKQKKEALKKRLKRLKILRQEIKSFKDKSPDFDF